MKLRLGQVPAHYFIFFSSLALFLFSLQRNFSAAHDSITYLNHISEGRNLFHPHHLLYNIIARGWLLAGQFLMPAASDYIVIEMLSAVFGSAIITLCFLFFRRRLKLTSEFSSIATAVIAFSYGVWSYSTNIEVYVPPIFFSLLVLYTITSPVISSRKILQAALYTSLATLFHQVNVLLLLVCLAELYKRVNRSQYFNLANLYLFPVILLTGSVYLFIAFRVEGVHNLIDFFSWITSYAHDHDYWRAPGITSVLLAMTGFIHAIFGGQFIFGLPFQSVMHFTAFNGHNLADEKFLTRNMQPWLGLMLSLLMLVTLILIIGLIISFLKNRQYRNPELRPLIVAFIIYSGFFFFWMPENLEFWIWQSILFWIILCSSGNSFNKKKSITVGIIAALLFLVNYAGSIFWLQDKDNDWYYSAIKPLIPVARSADLVITKDRWIMHDYVSRFTDCRQPGTNDVSDLMVNINKALHEGARVFVINGQDIHSPFSQAIDSMLRSASMPVELFSSDEPQIYMIR